MRSKDLKEFDDLPNAAHVDVHVVAILFANRQRFGLDCAGKNYLNLKNLVRIHAGTLASCELR